MAEKRTPPPERGRGNIVHMKPLALSGRKGWASRLACTCVAHSVCMGGKNAERERERGRGRERERETRHTITQGVVFQGAVLSCIVMLCVIMVFRLSAVMHCLKKATSWYTATLFIPEVALWFRISGTKEEKSGGRSRWLFNLNNFPVQIEFAYTPKKDLNYWALDRNGRLICFKYVRGRLLKFHRKNSHIWGPDEMKHKGFTTKEALECGIVRKGWIKDN